MKWGNGNGGLSFIIYSLSFAMFLGEYIHIFDPKNRISIPSKFRKDLGRVVVITRGLDNCLYLYSRKQWEKEARVYAAEVNGSAARRGLARLFLAGSSEVEVDSSGRVLVPEHLKSFASIQDKAVIAGVADRVEIWEEGAWKKYTAAIERDANAFAETVDVGARNKN
ncbi:MAG: division/cell wall cluster transcriptional repressor MraZ [Minisyncoccia bacterium]